MLKFKLAFLSLRNNIIGNAEYINVPWDYRLYVVMQLFSLVTV